MEGCLCSLLIHRVTGMPLELTISVVHKVHTCGEQSTANKDDESLDEVEVGNGIQELANTSGLDEDFFDTSVQVIDDASQHVVSFGALVQVLVDGGTAVKETLKCGAKKGNSHVHQGNDEPYQTRQVLELAGDTHGMTVAESRAEAILPRSGLAGAHSLPAHGDQHEDDLGDVVSVFVSFLSHNCDPLINLCVSRVERGITTTSNRSSRPSVESDTLP